MNNISFEYPEIFFVLLIFFLCDKFCKAKKDSIIFPNISLFSQNSFQVIDYQQSMRWIIILSTIIAISSPYIILVEKAKPKNGLNIALVLDTSESMRALGFNRNNQGLNRFESVKEIVSDFIKNRKDDNLGLVVFGEYAFVSSPLTFDKNILNEMLKNIHIGIAGKSTAIYDAIGQTVSLLKSEENSSNIAILLTDGINTAGILERKKALELAKNRGIKIYTIGIGQINEINPIDLQDIAEQTGGEFFIARDGEELKNIYNKIDFLEKREIKDLDYEIKEYLFSYPIFIAFLSLTFLIWKNRN